MASNLVVDRESTTLRAVTGELASEAFAVVVKDAGTLAPVPGMQVKYRVLRGPLRFDNDERESSAVTDNHGRATIGARFPEVGFSKVIASVGDDGDLFLAFDAKTDGVTDRLEVDAEPAIPAYPGTVNVLARAFDHLGRPVTAARVTVSIDRPQGDGVWAPARETRDGVYETVLRVQRSGEWMICVQDQVTRTLGTRCLFVTPGDPDQIRLVGNTDPRKTAPVNTLEARAVLLDPLGNRVDPARIEVRVSGKQVSTWCTSGEARFTVTYDGFGEVPVSLRDTRSDLQAERIVLFAGAVLGVGETVRPESEFAMPLRLCPPKDREVTEARIDVHYDAEMVRFLGSGPPTVLPVGVSVESEVVDEGLVRFHVSSSTGLTFEDYPDGLTVTDTYWNCLGAGDACFEVTGHMSPDIPGWYKCIPQKERLTMELCVRLIYRNRGFRGPYQFSERQEQAQEAGESAAAVISSEDNQRICCPIFTVHVEHHHLTGTESITLYDKFGHEGNLAIRSRDDFRELRKSGIGQKTKCMNLYLLEFDEANVGGRASRRHGVGAADPRHLYRLPNVPAHEFAHMLGVGDEYETDDDGNVVNEGSPGNLMSIPPGDRLTREQCRKVWENIERFKRS